MCHAHLFFVHRDHFPEMILECPNVTAILVHVISIAPCGLRPAICRMRDAVVGQARGRTCPRTEQTLPSRRAQREAPSRIVWPRSRRPRALSSSAPDRNIARRHRSRRKTCESAVPSALSTMERAFAKRRSPPGSRRTAQISAPQKRCRHGLPGSRISTRSHLRWITTHSRGARLDRC